MPSGRGVRARRCQRETRLNSASCGRAGRRATVDHHQVRWTPRASARRDIGSSARPKTTRGGGAPVARSAAVPPPTSTRAPTPSMCARAGIVAGVSLARAFASPRRAPRGRALGGAARCPRSSRGGPTSMPSSSTTAAAPREASTLARRSSSAARARPAAAAAASASPDSSPDPPPWRDEVLESHAALGNVAFVLCQPQGPQNVGSVARVMQNFGVYDLRLVDPGPFVLASAREDDVPPTDAAVPDGASSRGGVNSGAALGPDGLGDDLPPALRPTRRSNGPDAETERRLQTERRPLLREKTAPLPPPLCARRRTASRAPRTGSSPAPPATTRSSTRSPTARSSSPPPLARGAASRWSPRASRRRCSPRKPGEEKSRCCSGTNARA